MNSRHIKQILKNQYNVEMVLKGYSRLGGVMEYIKNLEAQLKSKDELLMEAYESIVMLSDLCRFLAKHQAEQKSSMMKAVSKENINDPKKMRDQIVLHTPIIQGSKNQWDLEEIGNQETNIKNIRKAVNILLVKDNCIVKKAQDYISKNKEKNKNEII